MQNATAIRRLLAANFVSGTAQGISMLSIPLYFQNQGLSSVFVLFYMIVTGLSLLWSPYAGTLIDKYNRKYIFLTINSVCFVLVGLAAGAAWWEPSWAVGAAAAVFALTFFNYNIHYPAVYAFMQEITEANYYRRIASFIEIQSQLAMVFAGAGAAFLLEGIDWSWCSMKPWEPWQIFVLNAGTYAAAWLLIRRVHFVSLAERQPEQGSISERLRTGWVYLYRRPYVLLFGVASFAIFVSIMIEGFYLAPLYVKQHLGSGAHIFAWSEVMFAGGAIFAGAAIQRLFASVPTVRAAILLTLIAAGAYAGMVAGSSDVLFLLLSFVLGWTNAGIRVLRMSYLFRVIDNMVAGRVGSIFHVSNTLFRVLFLGLFALPFFAGARGVLYALSVLGMFLLLAALVMMRFYGRILTADPIPASSDASDAQKVSRA